MCTCAALGFVAYSAFRRDLAAGDARLGVSQRRAGKRIALARTCADAALRAALSLLVRTHVEGAGRAIGRAVGALLARAGLLRGTTITLHAPPAPAGTCASPTPEPACLMEEQLSRHAAFLGPDALAALLDSHVVVVGLGAVGSHAAALLARSGVRRLTLADPTKLTEAGLSTHALGTRAHVGSSRAHACAEVLRRVVPTSTIEPRAARLDATTADALLGAPSADPAPTGAAPADSGVHAAAGARPSLVLLCIRHVDDLADALALCVLRGVPAIPCLHPRRGDAPVEAGRAALSLLHDVCHDADARRLTRRLRTALPAHGARPLPVPTQPLIHNARSCERALASAPASAADGAILAGLGHALAAAAIGHLSGRPLKPGPSVLPHTVRTDMWDTLRRREAQAGAPALISADQHAGLGPDGPLWPEDVEWLVNGVWGRRCALSGACLGGGKALALCRWEGGAPARLGNVVLVRREIADRHAGAAAAASDADPALVRAVRCTLGAARADREHRA